MHVLVGDGVETNGAAAKRVLAWVQQQPLPHSLRYFLMMVRCASHQANLVVGSAVEGRAALCAVATSAESIDCRKAYIDDPKQPHRRACATVVRVFKYLTNEYYTGLLSNLREQVHKLASLQRFVVTKKALNKSLGLARLYGQAVFPPGLLDVLDAGVGSRGALWASTRRQHSSAGSRLLARAGQR